MTLKGAKFVGQRPGPALAGSLQFSRGWSGKGHMEKMLFGQRLEEVEEVSRGRENSEQKALRLGHSTWV